MLSVPTVLLFNPLTSKLFFTLMHTESEFYTNKPYLLSW